MTGDFQPLIDSAAHWLDTDAEIRWLWTIVGAGIGTVAFGAGIAVIFRLIGLLKSEVNRRK